MGKNKQTKLLSPELILFLNDIAEKQESFEEAEDQGYINFRCAGCPSGDCENCPFKE